MSASDKIILVGFMGTGKTTVGKLLAEKLGWRFVDTDALIEKRIGKTIREFFAEGNETAFRQMETDLCAEIQTWRHCVVATGGGIILNPTNRDYLLRAGTVICLQAALEQIAARLVSDMDRPLLAGPDKMQRLQELLDQRATIYASMPIRIDTTGMTPFTVCEKVMNLWRSTR
jgi:shikimate kinase